MIKSLRKKWLALLMAMLLALPVLPLHINFASADETAEASESAPMEEKKEEKKEEVKVEPRQEAPKEEPAKEEPKAEEKKEETRAEEKKEETKPEKLPESEPEVKEEKKEESKQESTSADDMQDAGVEENIKPAPEPEKDPDPTPSPTPSPTPTIPAEEDVPDATPAPDTEATPAPEGTLAPEGTPVPDESPLPDVSVEPTLEPTATPEPRPDHFVLLSRSKSYENNHLNPASLPIPKVGMAIPLIYQYDYSRDVCEVDGDGRSVASSGCGATAASMIIAYVTGNCDQTPYTLFYWAAKNGQYFGDGLDYDSVRSMLSRYGVDSRMESVSEENIISALAQNRPIIINMGPGTFTKHGHYIVLRGLDSNGEVLVNDPNSSSRSGRAYSAKLIAGEAKRGSMLVVTTPAGEAAEEDVADLAIDEPEAASESSIKIAEFVEEDMQLMEVEPLTVEDISEDEVIEEMSLESFLAAPAATPEAEPAPDPSEEFVLEPITEEDLLEVQEETVPAETAAAPEDTSSEQQPAEESAEAEPAEPEVQPVSEVEPVPEAEPFEPFWGEVIVETVNLRDAPGQKGKVCALAGIGMRFLVVEQRTMNSGAIWYGVDNAGQCMYLRGDMILPAEAMPAASAATMDGAFEQAYTAEVMRDKVNLRKQPGRQGDVIANVALGTQLQVIGELTCEEDNFIWCEVDYEGQILYVRGDMLAAK